jgi:hypothetical protein
VKQVASRAMLSFVAMAATVCGGCQTDAYKGNKWCVIKDLPDSDRHRDTLYVDLDTGQCVPCDTVVDHKKDFRGNGFVTLIDPKPLIASQKNKCL